MKVAKGQLVLAPVAPLSNCSAKSSATAVSLGKHAVDEDGHELIEFFVAPPSKPAIQHEKPTGFPDDATVAGFWWIGTTDNKQEANIELSHVIVHAGWKKKDIEIWVCYKLC